MNTESIWKRSYNARSCVVRVGTSIIFSIHFAPLTTSLVPHYPPVTPFILTPNTPSWSWMCLGIDGCKGSTCGSASGVKELYKWKMWNVEAKMYYVLWIFPLVSPTTHRLEVILTLNTAALGDCIPYRHESLTGSTWPLQTAYLTVLHHLAT